MKHVLLANDDGVFAPGLRALADAFVADGWRVTVSAPHMERSAAAHSITIKRPLVAKRTHWEGVPKGTPLDVWSVDGTPADCAKLALLELSGEKVDLVVSGINNGWNVGTDVYYSGTVGAAREAVFEGYPAMAVSVNRPDPARYANAAREAVRCAHGMLAHPLPETTVLNLNLPDCAPEAVRGTVQAPLTRIKYTDDYDRMPRANGANAYWLKGDIIEEGCTPDGDLAMLLKGFATLTLLGWDMTLHGKTIDFLQDCD